MSKNLNTNSKFRKMLENNFIWLILLAMVVLVSVARPAFLTTRNIQALLEAESIRGILAFGMMWALLAQGIDLSVGASAALVATITASFVQNPEAANRLLGDTGQFSVLPAVIVGLSVGLVVGLINGTLIARFNLPPFIATLGMQLICRALSKMYSRAPVSNLSEGFRNLAKYQVFGFFPMILVFFILVFLLMYFLLNHTRFGKNIYAIGGNRQAAYVAGVNVKRNLVGVYVVSGLCAALGGILLAARTGSADPSTTGLNYELDAVAAATVGGTSHSGGIAKATGVLAGILIMGVINNGLVLLNVDDNMTNVIKGLIIIIAVTIDMRRNK